MLLLTPSVSGLFKWRQFEPEVILLAVGWYLRFSLSYRDVEELLAGCYRDNPAAHLGFFTDILNGFRVFYHYRLVRTRRNHAEKQSEHCDE